MVKLMLNLNFDKNNLKSKKGLFLLLFLLIIISMPLFAGNYNKLVDFFTKVKPPAPSAKVPIYSCPSEKPFCINGADISKDGTYIGFGADLPKNASIYASFDGKISTLTITLPKNLGSEKLTAIYLESEDKKVVYYFIGDSSVEREVKSGEIIGRSVDKIKAYNTSLVFQSVKDSQKGELNKVSSEDFIF